MCNKGACGRGRRAAAQAEFKQEQVAGAAASKNAPANVPVEHAPGIGGAALAALGGHPEEEAGQGEDALDEKDAAALEALRNDIFMRGAIPWCDASQLPWPRFPWLRLFMLGIGGGCCRLPLQRVRLQAPQYSFRELQGQGWLLQVGGHGRLHRLCSAGRRLHPAVVCAAEVVHGAGGVCACTRLLRGQRLWLRSHRLGPGAPG